MTRLSYFSSSAFVLAFAGMLTGCLAPGSKGECDVDEDCTARGSAGCDVMTSTCLIDDTVPDSQGNESGSFSEIPIAFHRGQLCVPENVQAGAGIPMYVNPCIHPCLDIGGFQHSNFFECLGSSCNLWVIQWAQAAGVDCPENVFGDFDPGICDYMLFPEEGKEITTKAPVREDGTPIAGTMLIEIPFLSNADMKKIDADPSKDTIKPLIWQYVRQTNRTPGNNDEPVSMQAAHPAPPEMCGGNEACKCHPIGM